MQIGVISDTHNFFDPAIPTVFAGVAHILHAGDIGSPGILQDLQKIAPVTAVGGNTDDAAFDFELTALVDLAAKKFLVHHIVNPRELSDTVALRIRRERPDVVVFGHTHKPFSQNIDGVLFFNPGYAGKSRFGMERSVAILDCSLSGITARYVKL